ncbi:unnamed protein product [Thelazia callipaeda]|uniref:Reverse transcriptase domain-containing protein n=1 Tax=Thelazia callipaeda TaxID=103827 RepID=A0A0N5CLA9_THECL|nr:unnamed protein product [Thelazia callipaeda]
MGHLNNYKQLVVGDATKQRIAERLRNLQLDDDILDKHLEWLNLPGIYGLDHFVLSLDKNTDNNVLIPIPSKKATTSRLCGTKLVEAIVKLCNGCVKPAGAKAVSVKRWLRNRSNFASSLS